jgi:hypothetical protein
LLVTRTAGRILEGGPGSVKPPHAYARAVVIAARRILHITDPGDVAYSAAIVA